MDTPFTEAALKAEADRFLASGELKRGAPLRRLFEYLAERSTADTGVSEMDIAVDVFGKDGMEPGDASVRVYIHRLRKKLDDFYGRSKDAGPRLVIPRGEYRLALAEREAASEAPGTASIAAAGRNWWTRPAVLAAGLAAMLAVGLAGGWLASGLGRSDPYAAVSRMPLWAEVTDDAAPVLVVVGDYYIFGETGPEGQVRRMVREFDVNSRLDLEERLLDDPSLAGRYADLDLTYVPEGAALALADVLPFLGSVSDGRLRMVTASELTPEMIKSNHIVYVGYLSGLGPLENTVFQGSRFGVGQGYDEIHDRETALLYISQAGRPAQNQMHHDYGYIASFAGPSGNRIIVLGGTRDIGVMQSAEVATDPRALARLAEAVDEAPSLEALYEVEGLGRLNMEGRLILSDRRPDFAEAAGRSATGG